MNIELKMENTMKRKIKSSYEEFVEEHPEQKKIMDEEYNDLLVSELLLASMEDDQVSVRKLAKAAGVSPTIIQALRSSKKTNMTLNT